MANYIVSPSADATGHINTDWSPSTGTSLWDLVDKPERQPTPSAVTPYIRAVMNPPSSAITYFTSDFEMTTTTILGTITSIIVWCYANPEMIAFDGGGDAGCVHRAGLAAQPAGFAVDDVDGHREQAAGESF